MTQIIGGRHDQLWTQRQVRKKGPWLLFSKTAEVKALRHWRQGHPSALAAVAAAIAVPLRDRRIEKGILSGYNPAGQRVELWIIGDGRKLSTDDWGALIVHARGWLQKRQVADRQRIEKLDRDLKAIEG